MADPVSQPAQIEPAPQLKTDAPLEEKSVKALFDTVNNLTQSVQLWGKSSTGQKETLTELQSKVTEMSARLDQFGAVTPEAIADLESVKTQLKAVQEHIDQKKLAEATKTASGSALPMNGPGGVRFNAARLFGDETAERFHALGKGSQDREIPTTTFDIDAEFGPIASLAMGSYHRRWAALDGSPVHEELQIDAGMRFFDSGSGVLSLLPSSPWPTQTDLKTVQIESFVKAGEAALVPTVIDNTAGIVKVTIPSHPFEPGMYLGLEGVIPAGYNGIHFVHSVDGDDVFIQIEDKALGDGTVFGNALNLNIIGADGAVATNVAPGDSVIKRSTDTLNPKDFKIVVDEIPLGYLQDDALLSDHIEAAMTRGREWQLARKILFGTGAGDEMQGLLSLADKTVTRRTSTENKIDVLRRSIAVQQMQGLSAGIQLFMNPLEWSTIELTKGSDQHYLLMAIKSLSGGDRFFAIPVTPITAMPANQAGVIARGVGTLYWRQRDSTVQIFRQHGTNATRGVVTLMLWDRGNLLVRRPEGVQHVFMD